MIDDQKSYGRLLCLHFLKTFLLIWYLVCVLFLTFVSYFKENVFTNDGSDHFQITIKSRWLNG